jgi:hypothetical protein
MKYDKMYIPRLHRLEYTEYQFKESITLRT